MVSLKKKKKMEKWTNKIIPVGPEKGRGIAFGDYDQCRQEPPQQLSLSSPLIRHY